MVYLGFFDYTYFGFPAAPKRVWPFLSIAVVCFSTDCIEYSEF